MDGDAGSRLARILGRQLVDAFQRAAAAAADQLAALPVDERFAGTPYEGRVLAPITPTQPVLSSLSRLSADAPPAHIGLHGWRSDPAGGGSVGIAYAATSGTGGVVLLTAVPAEGPHLVLRAAGLAGGELVRVPVLNDFVLAIAGITTDEVEILFHPEGPPTVNRLAAGARIDLELHRPDAGGPLGRPGGPSVRFGEVRVGGHVAAGVDGGLDRGAHLKLTGGQVRLSAGFLSGLLPDDLSFPLDLDLVTTPGGAVALDGSPSLTARLTGSGGRWLDLGLDLADGDRPAVEVCFRTSLTAALASAPVQVRVDGLGLSLPLSLEVGTPLLPEPAALAANVPDGAGVSLDLPAVAGSGTLRRIGDDLAGALTVRIPPMSAAAFGLLAPGTASAPLSFLVIIGATFPPPGVQLGFGFAITGVGGVVGVNRRIDRDALLRAVSDGTAAQLLFPSDPVAAGQGAIEALARIFPAARGSLVAGPMFQIGWGGRILTISAAVLIESSRQVKLTILGTLVLAVPDPQLPLVYLRATFVGIIDPAEPSVLFLASLTGSHIVGVPLTGDLLLLTRGGKDATLVVSAGGFHPAFPIPRNVPALRRLSMDLCPVSWISMRCEAYFALTSNTLQFGVRLELSAVVAGCGLLGWFSFDALVQYSPFRFVADVAGGIALRVFGRTLVGIALALHLEGPAPYLARGRGSIDLFLFEASFDFELSWGAPAAAVTARDVGAELRAALAAPSAWRSRATASPGLQLSAAAQSALAAGAVVDPYGTVGVRQHVVPLGVELLRFGGVPCPPQRWDLVDGEFGPGEPTHHMTEVCDEFAPGQFRPSRSDDEALTAEAFLPLRSGVELHPEPAAGAPARPAGLVWEERVIARDIRRPVPGSAGRLVERGPVDAVLAARFEDWLAQPAAVVRVEPVPPAAAASSWSMAATELAAASRFELAQVSSVDVLVVEAWEL